MRSTTTNTYAEFRHLTREWERVAETTRARRALAGWAAVEPALAELSSLRELGDRGVDHEQPGALSAERTGVDAAARLVCDAVEAGALPLSYAQVIYGIRIRRDSYREWSARTGRSVDALKQVCRRAEAKLARLAISAP